MQPLRTVLPSPACPGSRQAYLQGSRPLSGADPPASGGLAIQHHLQQLPCPICKASNYTLLRRAGGDTEGIYTAVCTGCRYSFQVSTELTQMKANQPELGEWLARLRCPACHHHGADLTFRCVPSVRDCYYFVTCLACGSVFREPAAGEAFE